MTKDQTRADLAGRVAIVTGASNGIGRAAALKLAARGARVLAVGRDPARLTALAADAPGINSCAADLLALNATDKIFAAATRLGPPTILVCSAGVSGDMQSPVGQQTYDGWRDTLRVNLDQPFLQTRAITPF
ncbi:MAG: SDR family NAD(P)-dependent oxidoreductase, partial [Rhodobacteraceae bacterium]|nr:SDR family NAD(P)-dependent oxidoreductase [Paracoccaceae bacterium]